MVKTGKFVIFEALLAVGAITVATGLAWACTAQAEIVALGVSSPSAGSQIEITGEGLVSGNPVEIRWGALSGPLLGEATADSAGTFLTKVTIPDVAPGIYFLLMKSLSGDSVARTSIEVSGGDEVISQQSAAAGAVKDLWSGYSSGAQVIENQAGAPLSGGDGSRAAGVMMSAIGLAALAGAVGVTLVAKRRRAV